MAEFADPLPVDYAQHAVGVHFPAGAPASYGAGDTLTFTLSSLAMTGLDDVQDGQVEVLLGDTVLGTFPVTNTLRTEPDDEAGTASVTVVLPDGLADGSADVVVRGIATGTEAIVPIATTDGLPDATVSAEDATMVFGQSGAVDVVVDPSTATGTVSVLDGATTLGSATLTGGVATVAIPAGSLDVGEHELTLVYGGDQANSGSQGTVTMTVTTATPTITATATPASVQTGQTSSIAVNVSAIGVSPTGTVTASINGSVVDSAPLTGGAATLTVGPFATAGDRTVTIEYSGDAGPRRAAPRPRHASDGQGRADVGDTAAVGSDADASRAAARRPRRHRRWSRSGDRAVTIVDGNGDARPADDARRPHVSKARRRCRGAVADRPGGHARSIGRTPVTATASSDRHGHGHVAPEPVKATPTLEIEHTPSVVREDKTRAKLKVRVDSDGAQPTGMVRIAVPGQGTQTDLLKNGKVTFQLDAFQSSGAKTVTVTYLGDDRTKSVSVTYVIEVRG